MNDKPIRVLLIEDSPTASRLIKKMLNEARYSRFDLECADRLSEGLKRLDAGGIEVVLLDLFLPDSSGLDTFATTHAHAPNIPIIVLTSADDETLANRAMRDGAQDYLVKGRVDSNLLARAIRYAIERKQVEEELLRRSEEKYHALFEESKDGVFIATPEGKFLDINPAGIELFAYPSKEELLQIDIGRDLFLNPDDWRTYQETIARQGFVKDYELAVKRKDGLEVAITLTCNVVRDSKGTIVAYRGIMRDITEQKRLQQQFFQAQKMESIGTLAGGVAHDFNNLLGGILGYASFMKTKMEGDHPFYRYIDTIEKSATRAAQLTAQLLGFARDGRHDTKPIDLNDTVAETLNLLGRTLDKSIEIETDLFDPLPTTEADAGQVQQALMNLCINARDAMADGGVLRIETRLETITEDYAETHPESSEGSFVVLSVADTGSGMDKKTREKIFEPFFTTKEEGKGTGLGLAMVYGVIKNHGGFVRVQSEPGVGSKFKIYLPASGLSKEKERSTPEMPRGGSELLLVVDDEEAIRALTKEMLETFGYKVMLAENGQEAVRLFEKHRDEIDLVILDMVMPKMGGRETFFRLKEISADVTALLSTGYSQSGKAQEILDGGFMGFLQKPYKLADLLSTVRNTLDGAMERSQRPVFGEAGIVSANARKR